RRNSVSPGQCRSGATSNLTNVCTSESTGMGGGGHSGSTWYVTRRDCARVTVVVSMQLRTIARRTNESSGPVGGGSDTPPEKNTESAGQNVPHVSPSKKAPTTVKGASTGSTRRPLNVVQRFGRKPDSVTGTGTPGQTIVVQSSQGAVPTTTCWR